MPAWQPSPGDVAAHVPQRFHGQPPDEHTVPSSGQIGDVIDARVVEVRNRCGRVDAVLDLLDGDDADALEDLARETVTLGAAAYLESSFFPEQQMSDSATAVFLRMRYEEHVRLLRRQVMTVYRQRRDPLEYPLDG